MATNTQELSLETVQNIERIGDKFHIHYGNGKMYVATEEEFDVFSRTGELLPPEAPSEVSEEPQQDTEQLLRSAARLSGCGCLISFAVLLAIFVFLFVLIL